VSARYRKLRQILRRKINIREDSCYCITAYLNWVYQKSAYLNNKENKYQRRQLLLYHCLLELGLPKVSISEQ
jgi:hypothetical protein